MVAYHNDGELADLARRYGIKYRVEGDAWPSSFKELLRGVQRLNKIEFDTYSSSHDAPWRLENRHKANWLAEQASRSSQSGINEDSWRNRIENTFLEAFGSEVACLRCKGRRWRSEVESIFAGRGPVWEELERRREKRLPCTCDTARQPRDRYETPTSKLFEDRIGESFVYEEPDAELPKQKPDRVIGLRATDRIREVLDQPLRLSAGQDTPRIRDMITCTPLKRLPEAPLFPFFLLEAKTDTGPASFSDIQTQTAFPIRHLLRMQRELRLRSANQRSVLEPWVWFLGYRGADWKMYGCYMSMDSRNQEYYNIHYLRSGDLTTRDGALHLLLLVDFIIDWARDTFREAIMAQLRSLAKGVSPEDISVVSDSDIVSKRKVQGWLTDVPSTAILEEAHGLASETLADRTGHFDIDPDKLPRSPLGAARPASPVHYTFTALRVTEDNVKSLLALGAGLEKSGLGGRRLDQHDGARKLLRHFGRWDEALVVLGADLDFVESSWTGDQGTVHEPSDEGPGAEFCVIFEYRCFFDLEWKLIRELSYVAISKSACRTLQQRTEYTTRQKWLERFGETYRRCPRRLLEETMDCLRSGSARQILYSALSSSVMTIYPGPPRETNHTPLTEALCLGYQHKPNVRNFLQYYIRLAAAPESTADQRRRFPADIAEWREMTRNRSFLRSKSRLIRVLEQAHDAISCSRCRRSGEDFFDLRYWDKSNLPSSTSTSVLVTALEEEYVRPRRPEQRRPGHQLSLFVLDKTLEMATQRSLADAVQDGGWAEKNVRLFHTILHYPFVLKDNDGVITDAKATLWNLPHPYRKSTTMQRSDISNWVKQLQGGLVAKSDPSESLTQPWVVHQVLLHFLRRGMLYDDAQEAFKEFRTAQRTLYSISKAREGKIPKDNEIPGNCVSLSGYYNFPSSIPGFYEIFDIRNPDPESEGPNSSPPPLMLRGRLDAT